MINKNRIHFGAFSGNVDYPDFLDIQIKSFQDFFQLDTDAENRDQEGSQEFAPCHLQLCDRTNPGEWRRRIPQEARPFLVDLRH